MEDEEREDVVRDPDAVRAASASRDADVSTMSHAKYVWPRRIATSDILNFALHAAAGALPSCHAANHFCGFLTLLGCVRSSSSATKGAIYRVACSVLRPVAFSLRVRLHPLLHALPI